MLHAGEIPALPPCWTLPLGLGRGALSRKHPAMNRHEIDQLSGLKQREITSTITGRGIASDGPVFYRITLEQFVLDAQAIQQAVGLEMMLGSPALAAAFGMDRDVAKRVQKHVGFVTGQEAMSLPIIAALGGTES